MSPLHRHRADEIAGCATKSHACRLALAYSELPIGVVACCLDCTPEVLSLLLDGQRPWTDDRQYRFELITGSLAPTQWDLMRRGLIRLAA